LQPAAWFGLVGAKAWAASGPCGSLRHGPPPERSAGCPVRLLMVCSRLGMPWWGGVGWGGQQPHLFALGGRESMGCQRPLRVPAP